ncbi:DUF5795 family protein [Natronomonas sp.]
MPIGVSGVTEFVTGYKCQDCGWSETDR